MEEKYIEESLWKIFDNINEWLRFAELKNAAIITLVAAEVAVIQTFNNISSFIKIFAIVILFISLTIAIYSFCPETSIPVLIIKYPAHLFSKLKKPKHVDSQNNSIIFFGHITGYSVEKYIKLCEEYFKDNISNNSFIKDLCAQIVTNSGIAYKKYTLFVRSLLFLLVGQIILFAGIALSYV